MASDPVEELAEELPEHQTSRGDEFRVIPIEDRYPLAARLVVARVQAEAGDDDDWEDHAFRAEMRKKKERYFYHAGELHIGIHEARSIWWSVVHDTPSAIERRKRDLL